VPETQFAVLSRRDLVFVDESFEQVSAPKMVEGDVGL